MKKTKSYLNLTNNAKKCFEDEKVVIKIILLNTKQMILILHSSIASSNSTRQTKERGGNSLDLLR